MSLPPVCDSSALLMLPPSSPSPPLGLCSSGRSRWLAVGVRLELARELLFFEREPEPPDFERLTRRTWNCWRVYARSIAVRP
jgi:hypothetical protein